MIAAVGLLAGLRGTGTNGRAVAFVATFGVGALLAWTLAAGQINGHYAYQFLPAVIAGIALAAHRLHGLAARGNARVGSPGRRGPVTLAALGIAGLATLWLTVAPPPTSVGPVAAILPVLPAIQAASGRGGELLYYQFQDEHWTLAGNRVVAEALARGLQQKGLLPASAAALMEAQPKRTD